MSKNDITGFPEWSPEECLVEGRILDQIRKTFETFGYTRIETRSVEPISELVRGGETEKEIYVVKRLHDDDGDESSRLGLHFDLTIPFARYAVQNLNTLSFPFKRYQIQKVWRGERPQEGRFREFYQADLDVIGRGQLSLWFDAELPLLLYETLERLPFPKVKICLNNRKIVEGFYRGLGLDNIAEVLRRIDKLDKLGERKVFDLLTEIGVSKEAATKCLEFSKIESHDETFLSSVESFGIKTPLLEEGLSEIRAVWSLLRDIPKEQKSINLRIARGLDYYTGTVYEGFFLEDSKLGAVCSGGRYDHLATLKSGEKLPGVGVSIGLTRILGRLFSQKKLPTVQKTPTQVLISLMNEESRLEALSTAKKLRARGIPTEIFHEPLKLGKQIEYASKKGIPYVWFSEGSKHEVKDIRSGEQKPASIETWQPSSE